MRKFLFGICTLFYLVAANGIPVFLHYCGGELEAVSYLTKSTSCCGEDESEESESDCCSNETLVLKTQLDLVQYHTARLAALTPIHYEFQAFIHPFGLVADMSAPVKYIDTSPPPLQNSELIDFTVMRI